MANTVIVSVGSQSRVAVPQEAALHRTLNPKRAAREVMKAMRTPRLSTKAQEAMRLETEARKAQSTATRKAQRDASTDYKRCIARAKAAARHRGH